ncbi:MAG: thiamine-phosphate kinase [Lentimicrobiaceae bacterium]|nr:thiamine-phosphate kinase [Lentimicrobiaceae bacterium]
MAETSNKRTELSELGEFGLIEHLTNDIKLKNKSTLKGIGDDAAVLDYGNKVALLSTDLLIEGVHFDMSYTPLKHLGYKTAVVNFSDIAAMNGIPKQITVSIAVSNRYSVEALEEFYNGLLFACERYGVDLVGGDTSSCPHGMFVSVSVVGEAEKDKVVYRKGAKEYDLVCVTGDLGAAYMGLLLLEREKQVFQSDPTMQPDLSGHDYILERHLKPEARTDIVEQLQKAGILPTSMIDISDGLASEILHICKNSEVGCSLYEDKLPIDVAMATMAEELNISAVTAAMNGGEDYELLFTIVQKDYEKLKEIPGITVIGHITAKNEGINLVSNDGKLIPITAQGWNHWREKNDREVEGDKGQEK